jgi:hypothetical protein
MDLDQFYDAHALYEMSKQKPVEDRYVENIFAILLFLMFQLTIVRNWNSPKDSLVILLMELVLVCHIYIGYQLAQSM